MKTLYIAIIATAILSSCTPREAVDNLKAAGAYINAATEIADLVITK